ncbi:hypothetical protein [Actinomadura litoris]|nr:hypothetical protein [Actinomadura litoris]
MMAALTVAAVAAVAPVLAAVIVVVDSRVRARRDRLRRAGDE